LIFLIKIKVVLLIIVNSWKPFSQSFQAIKREIRFAFELHDLDNSGFIDRHELKVLIKQSFIENNLDFDEFQLEFLVEEFFKKADKDNSNTIDF